MREHLMKRWQSDRCASPTVASRPRYRVSRVLGWVLGTLGLGSSLLGCAGGGDPAVVLPPPRVEEGVVEGRLLLTGELVAARAVEIYAPDVAVRPLEIRWLAENGSEVRAGDPLVELDSESILARLEDLRLAREQVAQKLAVTEARAAAQVLRAELALAGAEAEVERARIAAAVPAELQPAIEAENRRLALRKAEIDLERAAAELASARAAGRAEIDLDRLEVDGAAKELRRAETDLGRMTVRAPEAGLLLLGINDREGRRWQVGDEVWPGIGLARLPDPRSLRVEARLSDVDDGRLAVGSPALVIADALPELRFEARVASIEGVAQTLGSSSSSRAFAVILDLAPEAADAGLRPGASVRAEIRAGAGAVATVAPGPMPRVPRSSLVLAADGPRLLLADGSERSVELAGCDLWTCAVARGAVVGELLGRRGEDGP